MEKNLILAGVGGQGILTISYLICNASLDKGWNFKQAEVHGMAQRGGAVQSHLRVSSEPIASDLIPHGKADLLLSVEPLETLRYLEYLSSNGWVVTSIDPYKNIPDYPEHDDLLKILEKLPNKILVDSKKIAQDVGSVRTQNVIMLGVAAPKLGFSAEDFFPHLEALFKHKGEKIVQTNKDAIQAGYRLGSE
ncbi:indolepyruvate oxidoreductase subunit beta [bacterium]|nr:indolepyruvate oxidoreductase subunit beta [candidate division CSSED10-310 bacterium]